MPKPISIPGLFIELWSDLRFRDKVAYNDDWLDWVDDDIRKASIRDGLLSSRDGSVPNTVLRFLKRAPRNPVEVSKRAFLIAKMIDDIFAVIHPRPVHVTGAAMPAPAWLKAVQLAYQASGCFHEANGIRLVPSSPLFFEPHKPLPGGPIDSYFHQLQCIPAEVSTRIDHVVDEAIIRPWTAHPLPASFRVAVIPFATEKNHLKFRLSRNDTRVEAFQTRNVIATLKATLDSIVSKLVEDKVHIAVMPELVVGLPIARALQDVLRTKGGDELLLLVAGSGMGPEGGRLATHRPDDILESRERLHNTSFAFSGRGHLLWGQSKMHPYSYDEETLERVGLTPRAEGILEDAKLGGKLLVFDGAFGRCVTLICEDLARIQNSDWLQCALRAIRPTWILHPVLNRSIDVGGWFHQEAWPLVDHLGANVVTANSLVIERRPSTRRTADPDPGTGLLVALVPGEGLRIQRLKASDGLGGVDWKPEGWTRAMIN